jgi:hypothetical protein
MSDDARALIGRQQRRTPQGGVRVVVDPEEDRGQFTPVTDLLDRIHDPEVRWSIRMVWEHTANIEMRLAARIDASDAAQIADDVAKVSTAITDIHGAKGTNGKLGELRRRVDNLSSKAWWLFTAIVGGVGAALVKLVIVVRAFDAVEHKANASADQIKVLQAQVMTLQTALIARSPWPAVPAESSP